MKELTEAIETRIKSPIFGYATLLFLTSNWKPIYFLLFAEAGAMDKIAFFEANTNYYSVLIFPLLLGTAIALAHPWLKFGLLFLSKMPTRLQNEIHMDAEHKMLIKKKQLEDIRTEVLVTKEEELIDRASRDEKIRSIEDESTRIKLENQIKNLREERDNREKKDSYSNKVKDLIDFAKHLRNNSTNPSLGSAEAQDLIHRAEDLEFQAESLLRREADNW